MYHFAIPTTTHFVHGSSSFTGFNIHVNGSFHACLRYKQLHSLHEQLKRSLPNIMLPPFPSKKLFPLSPGSLEERRACLERYIQLIGQDPVFSKSDLLRSFLLAAQQESALVENSAVTFDVYLMNGHRIPVKCWATDPSSKVLEQACTYLELPREYTYYFALFLLRKDERGEVLIKRKLMDFESPYITQQNIGDDYKCVLRKCYWDSSYDLEVMRDPVALNLLYIQAVSDCERWVVAGVQTREDLASLQAQGKKKEYLESVKNLPNYGTIQFTGCTVDYPERNTDATVIIGNKEINFQTPTTDPNTIQEMKFRVTRIRCWKITTIHNADDEQPILELSFEFLMSKNYLKWIQIRSEKAMMMTVFLQSLVSELLNQKVDANNVKMDQNVMRSSTRVSFLKRDETNLFKPMTNELAPVPAQQQSPLPSAQVIAEGGAGDRNPNSLKQKMKISTTVFFKQNRVHNQAFEGIGDEDL